MAATVVFALVTASLLDRPGPDAGMEPDSTVALTGEEALMAPWATGDEPPLAAPALDQLSVEELEILLRELGT
jgi:hypothetical protein